MTGDQFKVSATFSHDNGKDMTRVVFYVNGAMVGDMTMHGWQAAMLNYALFGSRQAAA